MIRKRILLAQTLAKLGPRALKLNGQHRLRLRQGYYAKRYPVADWRTEAVKFISPFVIPKNLSGKEEDGMSYFSWDKREIPTDWHRHPVTGHQYPKAHWSRVPMFAGGDIKWIWEASRMDWVVAVCRAGLPDIDGLMANIRAWRDQNRPNEGVNWACGQETSLRMFVLMLLATQLEAKNRGAAAEIRAMLPQHAERVESAVTYAISQHNNHGLSETVALFLAGHALPDHERASIWRQEGKSWFCQQVAEQFTEDGWYAQHSHNYTRVALLDGLIALRVAAAFNDPLPKGIVHKLAAAAHLLAGLCQGDGRVPNYGSNDGANILPLHSCEYSDFRPVIAAVLRAAGEPSPFVAGHWDELSTWFGLPLTYGEHPVPNSSKEGGYYVLTAKPWRAMIRCHTYKDRPAHADMLHVDVWHEDLNLVRDGGTYSYNDPDGIGDFLKSSKAHNAVVVNGRDQMVKGSRFLWLDWTESRAIAGDDKTFYGEHYGYRTQEGVIHKRSVTIQEDELAIQDNLSAVSSNQYSLSFRLGDEGWVHDGNVIRNERFEIHFESSEILEIRLIDPTETGELTNAESTRYGRLDRTYAVTLKWEAVSSQVRTIIRSR